MVIGIGESVRLVAGGWIGESVCSKMECAMQRLSSSSTSSSRCEAPPSSQRTAPLPSPASFSAPRSVPGHDGGCYGLAFNRTGELLASGGADKCVKLWDPFTAAVKTTLRVRVRHACRCPAL